MAEKTAAARLGLTMVEETPAPRRRAVRAKRTSTAWVYLTRTERRRLDRAARVLGLSMSTAARMFILEGLAREEGKRDGNNQPRPA